jgi:hypothetical protein
MKVHPLDGQAGNDERRNYDGFGKTREKKCRAVCSAIGISPKVTLLLSSPNLPDRLIVSPSIWLIYWYQGRKLAAAMLHQQLVKDHPAIFNPNLAHSLNALSCHPAKDSPALFVSDLAQSLCNLSDCLADLPSRGCTFLNP